ncbi:MAG TPA: hypothetical protein PLD14_00425 [Candidatus Pacearchaeota archaeon]|nr:hypothetical protein [Candidatus Pacearchaeota archaeon]HPR79680.1 hypothetical protein [Candidatus Pacearchaeota archaeon]
MINNNQKGVSVYITVIIMSVLLTITLGLSSIIIGGAKMVEGLDGSVKAFHAADTGIEEALYNIRILGSCDSFTNNFDTDYYYTVIINPSTNCVASGTSIKSTGTYNTINRKIEAAF